MKQDTKISDKDINFQEKINDKTENIEKNLAQLQVEESAIKEIDSNQEQVIQNEKIFLQTNDFKERGKEEDGCTGDVLQVISDYLQMNSLEFQKTYTKDELYAEGILYCDKESWKYDGSQLDIYQENYYNVEDITAIRIYEKQSVSVYNNLNIGDQTAVSEGSIDLFYNEDYAVSIYKYSDDDTSFIKQISFIKIKLDKETASEELYQYIESRYYDVRESLESELWISSPDGSRAACVSNGMLPKHPAQIFIWNGEDKPYTIFRRTWEHEIIGWVDNEHLICYAIDIDYPVLLHLERNEIESIESKKNTYDTYGTRYSLEEKYLTAEGFEKQLCRWEILEKNGEVYVVEE